jgi:uncharacterized protein YjbI with pentapeptide repeats
MTCGFQCRPEEESQSSVTESTVDHLSAELQNEDGYWSCPHPTEGDDRYCCFHANEQPDADTLVDQFLSALVNESTTKTNTRRNEFVGAAFGNFDLRAIREVDNRVDVLEDIDIYLEHCHFSGEFDIGGFKFENKLSLTGSKFDSDLRASGIQCHQGVDLAGGIVDGKIEITDAEFLADTSFSDMTVSNRADFSDDVFRGHCSFEGATFKSGLDLKNVVFTGGRPSGNPTLTEITAPQSNLSGANLTGADLRLAIIPWANLESAVLSRSTLEGADLRGARLSGTTFGDTTINDATQILGHPNRSASFGAWLPIPQHNYCLADPRFEGDTPLDVESDITKAISIYKSLERLATNNALGHFAKKIYVRRQELQERRNRRAFRYGDSISERFVGFVRGLNGAISRFVFQYGESPWRVLFNSFLFIFAFASLYEMFDLLTTNSSFLDAVYYSALIFTTLGFEDAHPTGFGQFLTTIEAGLGAIIVALLVFVMGRRAVR